ncbi:winged helix-turn-helix domain-containing protein [Streptomyces xanthophaeus]
MTFLTLRPPVPAAMCCTMSRPDRPHLEGETGVRQASGQPEYQRVMEDLRRQIAEGGLGIGDPIPSTARLGSQYGVSSTVVRRAVTELMAEGLLYGQAGKGVFVQAQPGPGGKLPTTAELAATVRSLEAKLEAMAARLEALERGHEN